MRERLHVRHVVPDAVCVVCGEANETILHALFECEDPRDIWAHSDFRDLLLAAPSTTFAERFERMAGKVSNMELQTFCTLVWAAWFCRNERIHNGVPLAPSQVAVNFLKLVHDHQEYATSVFEPITGLDAGVGTGGWTCPQGDWVKANTDAHVGVVDVGLGTVVRDNEG